MRRYGSLIKINPSDSNQFGPEQRYWRSSRSAKKILGKEKEEKKKSLSRIEFFSKTSEKNKKNLEERYKIKWNRKTRGDVIFVPKSKTLFF